MDLPALTARFRSRHPGVDLELRVASTGTSGLLDQVRDLSLDVAFVGVETLSVPGVSLHPLVTYQPRLLVPAAHPLASADRVSLDQLAGERGDPLGDARRGGAELGGDLVHRPQSGELEEQAQAAYVHGSIVSIW